MFNPKCHKVPKEWYFSELLSVKVIIVHLLHVSHVSSLVKESDQPTTTTSPWLITETFITTADHPNSISNTGQDRKNTLTKQLTLLIPS